MAAISDNRMIVATIIGEIQSVLAAMRHNFRFSNVSGQPESPLVVNFKTLRKTISTKSSKTQSIKHKFILTFILTLLINKRLRCLKTVCDIIFETIFKCDPLRRDQWTYYWCSFVFSIQIPNLRIYQYDYPSPVKSCIFLLNNASAFVGGDTPGAAKAMVQVADTVTHCRFEATDPESDDVVLMKILRVLLACLVCPAGHLLTDDLVWSMLQTCFRMSIQARLGGKLKYTKHTNFY